MATTADVTPVKKASEYVKFDHPGRPVFVLVPFDLGARNTTAEELEKLFAKVENPPTVKHELKVERLPSTAVLYVAHPFENREKVGEMFENVTRVHVSEPVEVSRFGSAVDEDGLASLNFPAVIDTLQQSLKNSKKGSFYRVQPEYEKLNKKAPAVLKLLKLLNT